MPRPLVLASLVLASLGAAASAQDPADPLAGDHDLVTSSEIAVFWADTSPGGSAAQPLQQALFDYLAFGNPAIADSLQALDRAEASPTFPVQNGSALDAAVADFFGEPTDDVVALWETTDGSIRAAIPRVDTATPGGPVPQLVWGAGSESELQPAGTLGVFDARVQLRFVPADLDDDEASELAVGFVDATGTIQVETYDVEAGGLTRTGRVSDPLVLPASTLSNVTRSTRFDVGAGDLDGDGRDEVVLAAMQQQTDGCSASLGCWEILLQTYRAEGGALTLIASTRATGSTDPRVTSAQDLGGLAVAAGDVDGDGRDEVAVGIQNVNGSQAVWYVRPFRLRDGALVDDSETTRVAQTSGQTAYPLRMVAADLDLDGADEIVYATRQVHLLRFDPAAGEYDVTGNLSVGGGFDETTSARHVVVADLDGADTLWYEVGDSPADSTAAARASRPEIITVRHFDTGGERFLALNVLRDTGAGFQSVGERVFGRADGAARRPVIVAAGDFGDRGVRLGQPRYFRQTDITQPLVVLNAPPVHFDVFDGTAFDVAGCYPRATCDFSATYTERTSQTVEVTTEVVADWNLGAEVEIGVGNALQTTPTAGGTVGGASALTSKMTGGIRARFAASYGEGFTDLVGRSRTITVTSRVQIFQEDHLYADVVDLDVWEYPLYVRGQFAGYLALALPRPEVDAWFGISAPEATAYRPAHEPGNILSYARDLSPGRLSGRAYDGARYGLGSAAVTWDVVQEGSRFGYTEDRTRLRLEGELDLDIPIKVVNLGVNLSGDYSLNTFETHRTSVTNLEAVSVELGPINASIEGRRATYSVTPFVYWDWGGALVVDYVVEPSVAGPGEEPTWWQERYGQAPDLAFNLPNRYRDLKEDDPSVSLATKQRTRDLAFSSEPVAPGGTFTVAAQVHNYSLLPSPGGVPVRFYAGEPGAGGVALTGSAGTPDPVAPALEPRGSATVRADVTLPSGLSGTTVRIYAVVDPGGAVSEIHETNNTGWAPLAIEGTGPTADDAATPASPARLLPNAPNPFRSRTTLAFELPAPSDVRLAVYDALGRRVAVVVDEPRSAGRHTVSFEARGLASGVYIAQLTAGDDRDTRTLLLVE